MKTFKFNHNDYVTVTLTKDGADHINKKRNDFYDQYPILLRVYSEYRSGETYRAQFWSLINDFHEMMYMGMASPFKLGEITVESSLEN